MYWHFWISVERRTPLWMFIFSLLPNRYADDTRTIRETAPAKYYGKIEKEIKGIVCYCLPVTSHWREKKHRRGPTVIGNGGKPKGK